MKKAILKAIVFIMTFLVALVVIGKIMNKDHNNMTMEMAGATLPVITMEKAGISYNQLHGYIGPMEVAYQRDCVTILGENRDTAFTVDTFGRNVTGLSVEVRNTDGSRLIENSEIADYQISGKKITGRIALKDLIEKNSEYELVILLELDDEEEIRYYTRIIWEDSLHEVEKLQFVLDFHKKLFNREAARELTKYLETNYQLEDNSSFHKVNIHSSFKQITWGDMTVEEVGDPTVTTKEIAGQTATITLNGYVKSVGEGDDIYYRVQEDFRVRYTADRMYLLNYERSMTQIPSIGKMYANNKILFGIADENVPFMESEDGNTVVFESAGRLCSYDVTTNKMSVLFSFYDENHIDSRSMYDQYSVKILDVDEGGNGSFAVYGYMNRGRHEGEIGVQIYTFNSALNTIEELLYIPYKKSYSVLKTQMDQLLYLNKNQMLYLLLDHSIYRIDLNTREWESVVRLSQDDSIQVSENHKILVWQEGNDVYRSNRLYVRNLHDETQTTIQAGVDEAIRPFGFMGEDVIYGVAKTEDVRQENSGRIFFPMYKLCISNSKGALLKDYRQDNIYVTGCTMVDNQITLTRYLKKENGTFTETIPDHIMNNAKLEVGKNTIVVANIDVYEKYVQLQVRNTIDTKNIQILTPKEVVFEGGRNMLLPTEETFERFYVYGAKGVSDIYYAPANAVRTAYETGGTVVNEKGETIWLKGNRVSRNQIMAIKEPEKAESGESLAVCLDTIFAYEGLVRNSSYLLGRGQSVLEILENNLTDAKILDLTGCKLDALLYFVNKDIPVLVLLKDGEAVLLTGFNEFNVVLFEPSTGKLYKNGMNDTAQWLEENGNCFITYVRK